MSIDLEAWEKEAAPHQDYPGIYNEQNRKIRKLIERVRELEARCLEWQDAASILKQVIEALEAKIAKKDQALSYFEEFETTAKNCMPPVIARQCAVIAREALDESPIVREEDC